MYLDVGIFRFFPIGWMVNVFCTKAFTTYMVVRVSGGMNGVGAEGGGGIKSDMNVGTCGLLMGQRVFRFLCTCVVLMR